MIENPLIMKYLKHNCHVIYLKRDSYEKLFDGRRPKLKNKKDYLLLKERREPLLYRLQLKYNIKKAAAEVH